MASRDKILCGVCSSEMVKKNLNIHFQRRHPGQNATWKLPWAKDVEKHFKIADHSNSKNEQISSEVDAHQENVFENNNKETQDIAENSNENIAKDCLDDRASKRARYDDEKPEKSIADVLQAIQSKCYIIYIYLLLFVFESNEFTFTVLKTETKK